MFSQILRVSPTFVLYCGPLRGYSQAMGRVHAYVDGFNLYYAIRGWKHLKWLDIRAFAEAFVDPGDALAHIYYFTAMVRPTESDPDKPKRQIAYVNALESLSRVSVVTGTPT